MLKVRESLLCVLFTCALFVLLSSDVFLHSVPCHSATVCQLLPQSARNCAKSQTRVRTGASFLTAHAYVHLYFLRRTHPSHTQILTQGLTKTPPSFKKCTGTHSCSQQRSSVLPTIALLPPSNDMGSIPLQYALSPSVWVSSGGSSFPTMKS